MFVLEVQKLLFILVRVSTFIAVCPGFSYRSLPNTVKVAFAMAVSWLVYVNTGAVEIYSGPLGFGLAALLEAILGLAMGYVTRLVFSAVEMGGQLIDFQAGYTMGAVYDPGTGTMSSNYGRLYYWMSVLVFFLLDLHHVLIRAVMASFQLIQAGHVSFSSLKLDAILYIFSASFSIAFSIAAPMIIVLLMADVVMGIISRTVPQLNVLMLGMPAKSIIGFIMFLALSSSVLNISGNTLGRMAEFLENVLVMFR